MRLEKAGRFLRGSLPEEKTHETRLDEERRAKEHARARLHAERRKFNNANLHSPARDILWSCNSARAFPSYANTHHRSVS